jgi:hypothetical protein
LVSGTLEPDYSQTEGLIFFQPYDLDESTSRLFAVAEELGIDLSEGDARFGYAVSVVDDSGDYPLVEGKPAIDRIPVDLESGSQLIYEQGKQACLSPYVDVDVPGRGQASVDLSSLCNAPADGQAIPMRLLVSLPYNMPGPDQVQTRSGQVARSGPTPPTTKSIYLPYGNRP